MNLSRIEYQIGWIETNCGEAPLYQLADFWYHSETEVNYLIHLGQPIGNSSHYWGSTSRERFPFRLREHSKKRRKFKVTERVLEMLSPVLSPEYLERCQALKGREFHKKSTFQKVLEIDDHKVLRVIMKHANQHNGSALLIEANIRGIHWHVDKVYLATRELEIYLKKRRKKGYKELCLTCRGEDVPF